MYSFQDCFWLLSTFVEYANHNVLYSAFKEASTASLQQNAVVLPKRLSETSLVNFSKVLNSKGECMTHHLETAYPIRNILAKNKPQQELVDYFAD